MKNFDRSDDVSAKGSRGTEGGGGIPQLGAYVPSYKGVNQVLYTPGGGGAISFWDALAKTSEKDVAQKITVYQSIELSNSYVDYNKNMMESSKNFKANSPSGEGYLEHITETHDKLADQYIQKASSSDVASNMKLVFAKSKENWANQAFRDQNEMMSAHAINKYNENTGALLIDLMNNPDNVESIYSQYQTAQNALHGLVPATELEAFQAKSNGRFAFSYGMGLVKRDPYSAKELINSPLIKNKISPEDHYKLVNMAKSEVRHREIEALRQEVGIQKAKHVQSQGMISDLKLGIAKGTTTEDDINGLEENGWVSKVQANSLRVDLVKAEKGVVRGAIVDAQISEAIKNKTPIPMSKVSGKKRVSHFEEYVEGQNQIRRGAGKAPLSITEKVNYVKENSLFYNVNIPSLTNEVVTTITRSNSPHKVLDACIAITENESLPSIKNVDNDSITFARYVVDEYKATKNLDIIKTFRDDWYNPINRQLEKDRKKDWKEEKVDTVDPENLIKKELGYSWLGRKFSGIPDPIKDQVLSETKEVMERIYSKTGSETKAINTASSMVISKFRETEVNGASEYMYNAPTKGSVGLDDFVIKNIVGVKAQEILERIDSAVKTGTYKGQFQIRKKKDFIDKEKRSKFLEKPITLGKTRPVEVLLNDVWEQRNLKIESMPRRSDMYAFYVQIDPDDPTSKAYIMDPGDPKDKTSKQKRAYVSFGKLKKGG
ncbi:MAG: hypothetical protein EOM67_01530 [Spirochaetia bacterium]|nr:hypothetical protein [Spirochaetia bacterium]